jgi:hypothetical protein
MNAPSSEFRNEYERVTGFDVEEFTGSHDAVKVAAAAPAALKNERLKILLREYPYCCTPGEIDFDYCLAWLRCIGDFG